MSREEEKLINALKTGTVLNDSQPEVIDPTDYISDNGVAVSGEPLNYIVPIVKGPTPPPQKPNHTPIFVLHKEDQSKRDTNFTRVPTTRLPSRLNQDAVFPPPKDKKEFAILTVPSPIRPFLSRGSVAERVLIFEKCPEKAPARTVVTVKEPVKAQVSS